MNGLVGFLEATNLHLWLLLAVAAAVSVFVGIQKVRKRASPEIGSLMLTMLLALAMSYGLQEVIHNVRSQGNVAGFVAQLERFGHGNPFALGKLAELKSVLEQFVGGSYEVMDAEGCSWELERALKACTRDALFLDHYPLEWDSEGTRLWEANRNALGRGVRIVRIFVLNSAALRGAEERARVLKILARQDSLGIEVRVVSEMSLVERYREYPRFAGNNVALFDGTLLMTIAPASQWHPVPAHAVITWRQAPIRAGEPFTALSSADFVRPWTDRQGLGDALAGVNDNGGTARRSSSRPE